MVAFPQETGNNAQELPLPTSDVDEMPNIDESSEAENATESAANSNSLYPKAYLPLSTKVLMKSDLPECSSPEECGKHMSNIKMPWIKRMLCGCFVSRAKTRPKTSFVDDRFKPKCIPPHSELTVKNIPSSALLGNLPSSVECNVQNISIEDGKEPVISCWSSDHKKRSSKPHKKSSNVKNIDKVIGPNQEIAPRLDNEHTVSITDDLSSVDKSATEDVSSTPIAKTNMVVDRADFRVGVEIDGLVHQVYVLKRPFVDEFLQAMAEIYECILFTASLAKVT
ncbi:unnamed protein product [Protopolystoma xenopodis]|uniref:Mitochondrial import inner membrane translocase subunit TIM50 n=1 Tax=Protopolystoma xenopodis TaxID=117903 RepID=A0A3S5CJJ5_9PLAT|nr:unnamed protein product [Protopolystoma xenopodis]